MKNASAQQDALADLETRSKALRLTEQRLREQVKHCEGIKAQLSDKFKLIRDDRTLIMGRLDHTDTELLQYRKDIRELHDQVSRTVLQSVSDANARSLVTENGMGEVTRRIEELRTQFDTAIHLDLREQAVQVQKLNEHFISQRSLLATLDKAIVT